eukprot:Tbor_TRINITY_DN6001_c4_g2::TRINITY_DN6001_c4_g2_i1::g.11300::m.11300
MVPAALSPSDVENRKITKIDWMDPPPPQQSPLPIPLVNGVCSIVDKKVLYVGGYSPSSGGSVNATAEFDLNSRMWSSVNVPIFPRRISEAAMESVGCCHFLFGGWDDKVLYGDLWTLQTQSNGDARGSQWTLSVVYSPNETPCPRRGHSMTAGILEEKATIFLFGGFNGKRRLSDLWALNVESMRWSLISPGGLSPRDRTVLRFDATQNCLLLFGGYTSSPNNDCYSMSLSSTDIQMTWKKIISSNPPPPLYGSWSVVLGNLFIVGFGSSVDGPSKRIYQMHIVEKLWTIAAIEGLDPQATGRCDATFGVSQDNKRAVLIGGTTSCNRYLTSMLDIEFDKSEPQAKTRK